jgi:hypothetical protein
LEYHTDGNVHLETNWHLSPQKVKLSPNIVESNLAIRQNSGISLLGI